MPIISAIIVDNVRDICNNESDKLQGFEYLHKTYGRKYV